MAALNCLVPAIGIEPTSTAFQAIANPSQLHRDNVRVKVVVGVLLDSNQQ